MASCANASLCDSWYNYTYGPSNFYPQFKADPDIAGAGVDYAFLTSAAIALLFELFVVILSAPGYAKDNKIDDWVYKLFCKCLPNLTIKGETRSFWIPISLAVITNLCDQMLLLGLSASIAGFALHCSISVYHSTIVADIAWLAANVHLITLGILKPKVQEIRGLRSSRVFFIIIQAVFLLVTSILQGHLAWYDSYAFNAQCLWNNLRGIRNIGGNPKYWMNLNIALILVSHTIAVLQVYDRAVKFCLKWIFKMPSEYLRKILERNESQGHEGKSGLAALHQQSTWLLAQITFNVHYWGLKIIGLLINSQIVGFFFDSFWFSFGTWGLVIDRRIPEDNAGQIDGPAMDGDENEMGFGQIVPIVLLSSMILIGFEAYLDERSKREMDQATQNKLQFTHEMVPPLPPRSNGNDGTGAHLNMPDANETEAGEYVVDVSEGPDDPRMGPRRRTTRTFQ